MSIKVPMVSPLSRAAIETMANQVIRDFSPERLSTPGAFAVRQFFEKYLPDTYQLDTGAEELPDGIEGLTFPDGRVFVSEETYLLVTQGNGRARHTMIHEGFHGIQHREQIKNRLIHFRDVPLYRREAIPAYRDPEWQAHRFAAAILAPESMVRLLGREFGNARMLIQEMVGIFGISRTAAEVRLKQLGIIE